MPGVLRRGTDERIRDLVLDQIGAAPHPLGEDDDLRVGEVRQGIERRLADRVDRPEGEHQHRAKDEPLVSDR